jgi:hypothetical protein
VLELPTLRDALKLFRLSRQRQADVAVWMNAMKNYTVKKGARRRTGANIGLDRMISVGLQARNMGNGSDFDEADLSSIVVQGHVSPGVIIFMLKKAEAFGVDVIDKSERLDEVCR